MFFDGVALLKTDENKQNEIKESIENIYNNLSTNYSEYVDNTYNLFSDTQNIAKAFNYNSFEDNNNFMDIFQKAYNNVIKTSIFADKTKGLSGYVENFVDNSLKNSELFEVIHKNYDYAKSYNSESSSISEEYKTFAENIKNVENSNENKSAQININMGGITQNITDYSCDDAMDMLAEKLMETISGCADGIY